MAKYDAFIGAIPHLASLLREYASNRASSAAENDARARQVDEDLRTFASGLTEISAEQKRLGEQVSMLATRLQSSDEQNRAASQQLTHLRELYELQRASTHQLKMFCIVSLALNAVALIGLAMLFARR